MNFARITTAVLLLGLTAVPSTILAGPRSTWPPPPQGAEQPPRKYVQSLLDFMIHCLGHIERTTELAEFLTDNYGADFGFTPGDKALVMEFMRLHDRTKIKNIKIQGELYKFYGTTERTAERDRVIDQLNAGDREYAEEFFRKYWQKCLQGKSEPTAFARQLLRLEKIADLVDRGMSEVSDEEFARPRIPGSKFIKNPEDARLATILEAAYHPITRGSAFREFKKRWLAGSCVAQFGRALSGAAAPVLSH